MNSFQDIYATNVINESHDIRNLYKYVNIEKGHFEKWEYY